MPIDSPKFAIRYMPVRDVILALSAHYKRRPGSDQAPIAVIVHAEDAEDVLGVRVLLDGFDVDVYDGLTALFLNGDGYQVTIAIGLVDYEHEMLIDNFDHSTTTFLFFP